VLVQLNFDKTQNGGITLAKADQLFDNLSSLLGVFLGGGSSVTVTQTCALKPSQVNTQYHVNGLQAAQQLTGTYPQYGFQSFVIVDSFWWLPQTYLGKPPGTLSLRSDLYGVRGSNNVGYTSSFEFLQPPP
jgi:hypothetical protein